MLWIAQPGLRNHYIIYIWQVPNRSYMRTIPIQFSCGLNCFLRYHHPAIPQHFQYANGSNLIARLPSQTHDPALQTSTVESVISGTEPEDKGRVPRRSDGGQTRVVVRSRYNVLRLDIVTGWTRCYETLHKGPCNTQLNGLGLLLHGNTTARWVMQKSTAEATECLENAT